MRKFMLGGALAATITLGGCSTAQIEAVSAQIEGDIQAGAAALCGIVPTVGTILNVVVAVTGASEVSGLVGAGVTAVEQDICSAAPPKTSARYRALPRANYGAPAAIGVSQRGVAIAGWRT